MIAKITTVVSLILSFSAAQPSGYGAPMTYGHHMTYEAPSYDAPSYDAPSYDISDVVNSLLSPFVI